MRKSISSAKLRPPKMSPGHISRPRLLQKLENGQQRKLTLIIAGAGYGKSTLLAEWVRGRRAYVWYSLDAPDRDPAVFFSHFLAGLQENWPEFGRDTQALLNRPVPPDPERLMLSLLGEIEAAITSQDGQRPLLLFDDYHRLEDASGINAAMKLLLERLPPAVHVTISSRTPLDFTARLGPAGQISKLTTHDLRFRDDEVLQILGNLDTTSSSVQQFLRQTEGWVAGLQLLRQALQHSRSLDLEETPGTSVDPLADVYAFLAEELFARQSLTLQQFLLQTAILDTFSPEDCDAIFERCDSARLLAHLMRQNLFTIHLQRKPDIYRYHHLLTDYLRRKVRREKAADQIRGWHRQAADHFRQQQRWIEAFDQAHKSGDESFAIQVLLQASQPMLLAGQLNTLEDWLGRFSPETYAAFPRLYSLKGDVWFRQANYERAMGAYQQAINVAEKQNDRQTLLHAWHGIGAIRDRTGERESARTAFSKALNYVDQTGTFSHLKVLVGLANNLKVTHHNEKATELYRQCLELAVDAEAPVQAVIMHNLGIALQEMGEFSDALHWFEKSLLLRRKIGFAPNIANSLNSISMILCALGEFEPARRNLEEALLLCVEADSQILLSYVLHNRGDLALAEGDLPAAENSYRESKALKEGLQDVPGLAATEVMMGDLYRRQGDLMTATACAERALHPGMDAIGFNAFLMAQTVLAQILLDEGKAGDAADLLVDVIDGHETRTKNKFELAKSWWHLARAHKALEQSPEEALAKALALVQQWHYHFLLYTLAQESPGLLAEAVAADSQPALVTAVMTELGEAAVPGLVRLLTSSDAVVQARAIQQMGALGADGVWKPLAKVARDKGVSPQVRGEARKALGQLKRTPPAPLHVTVLGDFALRRGDQLIPDSAWGSRKAQTLFKYLLQHVGAPVHREELINLFWPETLNDVAARDKARGNLNQLVSWVRQTLEPYLPAYFPSRYLSRDKELYQLELPEGSWVDAQRFQEVVVRAERARQAGDVNAMLAHFDEGAVLYQGDYLAEHRFEDWCIKRRERLRLLAIRCFYELAKAYLERDRLETAISHARRLLELEPWHENGCAVLVRALTGSGQIEEARRACKECRERLKRELDVVDSPALDELCRQITS